MTSELPLSGVRVLDMADEKAELCGRLLADLGADVVRLEPGTGAVSRSMPPHHEDHSLYFAVRNANKRGGVVDLSSDAGRARLLGLLERADIWVETSRPSELAGIGLDPAALAARFDHLVVTSITDYGQTGPYRDWEATDPVMIALAGELFRSGSLDRPPLLVPGALAYDVAGIMGAFASLTAYWQRLAVGRGQHIDLSVLEATAQVTDWALPNASAIANMGMPYAELRMGSGFVYPMYPCADGYVRLVVLSPRQWRSLRAWLGEPEVVQDEHWDALLSRMSIQEDILDPLYLELFADRTMVDLATEAQARGIVLTPVLDPPGVLGGEHFVARRSFVDAEVAPGRHGPIASGFFEIDGERAGFRHRAPTIGEHDAGLEASWPLAGDQSIRPADRPATDAKAASDTTAAAAASATAEPATTAETATSAAGDLPLRGLLVLDFGHGGVGVEAGRLFAEYGADVIKVESRSYPDFIRLLFGSEMSPSFASSSRSKRSLGLNVKTPEGLRLIRLLISQADVIIENNSTGTMEELGLGWDELRELNPGLVMLSSQLMGSRGPWAHWLGYGPSTRPVGGMTWLWNWPDGGMPPGAFVIFPDHVAGRLLAVAGLACLVGRRRGTKGGAGSHIEVAQAETVLGMLADCFLQEGLAPGSLQPAGNRSPRGAPWGVYQCQGEERWCVITCRHDEDWQRLRKALGDPEWASRPELESAAGRHADHDELDRHLNEWTAGRTDREAMEHLQAHGVPAAMMAYASDQPQDPQLVERGYIVERDQPGVGPMILEGAAFHASAMGKPRIEPAPALGEHTRGIGRDLLGLHETAVQALIDGGVLEVTL